MLPGTPRYPYCWQSPITTRSRTQSPQLWPSKIMLDYMYVLLSIFRHRMFRCLYFSPACNPFVSGHHPEPRSWPPYSFFDYWCSRVRDITPRYSIPWDRNIDRDATHMYIYLVLRWGFKKPGCIVRIEFSHQASWRASFWPLDVRQIGLRRIGVVISPNRLGIVTERRLLGSLIHTSAGRCIYLVPVFHVLLLFVESRFPDDMKDSLGIALSGA